MLVGGLILSGIGAVLALVFIILPRERRKGADALLQVATAKSEALKTAAVLLNQQAEVQAKQVDQKVEQQKQADPVDIANDFINGQRKS